jgi:protein-S-isoprenylcysteine O-methyltransferase Ste14
MGDATVFQVAAFVVVSAAIVVVSWPSLRDRRSHGFYRFFAFESILILILLNVPQWFRDPFAARQIISWVLLSLSLILAVHGFHLLRVAGKPQGQIENTSTLVTTGAYRFIRHPLYSSLLLLSWGAFLKGPSAAGLLLAALALGALVVTARVEERENLARFGPAYAAYIKKTRMFIPFVF